MSIRLTDFILQIKEDLRAAGEEDPNPMFKLDKVKIRVKITASKTGNSEASFDIYVVHAKASGDLKSEDVHEVTLELLPIHTVSLGRNKS